MADEGSDGIDRRNELAAARTELANQRTQLANERTFSAWVRTGLAFLVAGFSATRLLGEMGPSWLLSAVGVLFVILGALAFLIAGRSYRNARDPAVPGLSGWLVGAIAALLIAVSCVSAVLILGDGSRGF